MSNSIESLPLGTLLTILFSQGIRFQGNADYSDWDFVKPLRDGDPQGREYRFQLQTTLSPASVRYRNPTNRSFPKPQSPQSKEYIARYCEINGAVGMEQNLYERAVLAKDKKYADPFAEVVKAHAISQKKRLSADLYLDGSGVICEAESVDESAKASGRITVKVSTLESARGHTGAVERNEKLICAAQDGTARNPSVSAGDGTFDHYLVVDVDRENDKLILQPTNSNGDKMGTVTATQIVATDVFYLNDSFTSLPDLTDPSLDFGNILHAPGLASLAASDGRKVHGIEMSGMLAGSDTTAEGNVIGLRHLQKALTKAKTRVGEKDFKWEKFIAAPEVFDAFIEINEADKRIQTEEDKVRGGSRFVYQHRSDTVELMTSIYCPKNRIWMPPTPQQAGEKIIEAKMTDFKPVSTNGVNPFHLGVDGNGSYTRDVIGFMQAYGTFVCKQPAAIASISDFKLGEE